MTFPIHECKTAQYQRWGVNSLLGRTLVGHYVASEDKHVLKALDWQLDAPLVLTVSGRSFDWNPAARRALSVEPVGKGDASPFQPISLRRSCQNNLSRMERGRKSV